MKWVWLGVMLWTPIAWADCVERPAPVVPRYLRQAVAYSLAFDAGHDLKPHDGQGLQIGQSKLDTVCFDGLTQAQIGTFLTDQTMADRHTAQEAERQAAAAVEAARQTELATIESQLESDDTAWSGFTTNQKLAVMKKLLRREALREQLKRN